MRETKADLTDAERVAVAAVCPHTDCQHENTYTCSGWAYALDVLGGLHDAGYEPPRRALCIAGVEPTDPASGYPPLGEVAYCDQPAVGWVGEEPYCAEHLSGSDRG